MEDKDEMAIKDLMDLCRLQGAVEAVAKYIICTSKYELDKILLLRMLDVGGIGYDRQLIAEEVKNGTEIAKKSA